MQRARVLLLNAAVGPFDYRVPDGMDAPPGTIVSVPLGPRQLTGIVWDPAQLLANTVEDAKLRPILAVKDAPPLSPALMRLALWCADYYCAPLAMVARMILPSGSALSGSPQVSEYRWTGEEPPRMTPQRQQALAKLGNAQGTPRELARMADVSEGVIRGLIQAGVMEAALVDTDRPFPAPKLDTGAIDLSAEQQAAANRLVAAVRGREDTPFLLDGVTGSGKTEVYFAAIAEAVREGRQTLVLLPEIALTQPFLTRFEQYFGAEPAAWHSGLRQSERRRAWRAIASGEAKVVVGARSALFLPFANLGLIAVDEAHETSFKQEDGVRYNARDVAVMRGKFERCPVILASATPAIESHHMAESGVYERLVLPSRFGGAALPDITAVDMRVDTPARGRWIAPPLEAAIDETLERGEQALLFLNRRGYAPLTLCRHCGYRFQCPDCSAWLVEHRLTQRLSCHHCGRSEKLPDKCPECGTEDALVACGPGVERIAEEVAARWPAARTEIVTSDTIWSPDKAAEFVGRVEQGAVDIIIGTQLVTKGYHFPELTLVGVIDADIGLDGGDLRAAERSFHQIAQVSGRAGRAQKPGRVLVQTHNPDAPVINALVRGDREAFYAAEIAAREIARMPPFGRLAAIILSSEDDMEAREAAQRLRANAPDRKAMRIYGPAPAPLAMLRGRYRYRLLVHASRKVAMQAHLRQWLGGLDWPRGVRVAIDVDPYSFL